MKKILIIASLNMDFTTYVDKIPEGGETTIGKMMLLAAGGKGLNQAVAISRANSDVTIFGKVGDDQPGHSLLKLLENENIKSLVKIEPSVGTGTATILIDKNSENRIVVVPGANHSINFDEIKRLIDEIKPEIICFQLENPISSIEDSIKYASLKNIEVLLNPAPAHELKEETFRYITYFTPNETELSFYAKHPIESEKDLKDAAKILLDKGIKNLIVTLGSKGAAWINLDHYEIIPGIKVKAIDTVAAGDCFNGYFISAISKGKNIKEAILDGHKAASIAVTKKGAVNSIPFEKDIK